MQKLLGVLGAAAALLLSAAAQGHEASKNGITVAHPWIRANPAGSTLTAAFMELKSAASAADKLVAVATPAAGRAELHTHVKDGDVMKMRRVDAVELKPGESRILKPSGDHVMLLDLKASLKEGDIVKLTLTFEKAGPIEIDATVEPPGATGPHGMDHSPGAEEEKSGHEHHQH